MFAEVLNILISFVNLLELKQCLSVVPIILATVDPRDYKDENDNNPRNPPSKRLRYDISDYYTD